MLSEIGVVAAALISLIGTIGAIHYSNVVGHLKDVELEKYKTQAGVQIANARADAATAIKDAGVAKDNAAQANSHLGDANKQAAEANKKAAEANAAAQEAVLDKTKILNDNLKLQQQMDQEQNARQTIEQNLAPRDLSRAMQQQMIGQLRSLSAQDIDFIIFPGNPEAQHLESEIAYVFQAVNWQCYIYSPMGGSVQGVTVEYDPADKAAAAIANIILTALQGSRIAASISPNLPPIMQQIGAYASSDGAKGTAKVRVFVGSK